MSTTSPGQVVVGIDGTPASDRGVEYAAIEAQRLGVALHLVHANPGERAAGPPLPIIPASTLRTYSRKLLERAGIHAREAAAGLEVEASVVPGGVVASLVASCERASMLVLGAERRSFAGRIWTGDIVAGVAARASCPVVVVPPEWQPGKDRGRVVVGLKSIETSQQLIRAGLEFAHARHAELVVVNAWKLQSGYDDIVANRADADEWGRHQTSLIEPVVQELRRDDHLEVPVRIEVLHAQPAVALVNASAKADRLLIARPKHGAAVHHLGAVGRAVLHEARCPVEVLPPAPDESRRVAG